MKHLKSLLFVVNQFYKGGAESALLTLLCNINYQQYAVDFLILNQVPAQNAISLIAQLPVEVRVCDAYTQYQSISILKRAKGKFVNTAAQKQTYLLPALEFVKNKQYDWAFHVGEWHTPSFVAQEVNAARKATWIHADLNNANAFDQENFFYYNDFFDYHIFVSKNSMQSSIKAYPFIAPKTNYLHNLCNVGEIQRLAKIPTEDPVMKSDLPILVTCANIRQEKNHLRQIAAMATLKKAGHDFLWINIGSMSDKALCDSVRAEVDKNGLTERFLLLGAKDNPYQYMKKATAVTVLSDYESWSMVITEAKVLGIPIIATATSGAQEQLIDGETGLLCDFSAADIAQKISSLLTNAQLREKMHMNLEKFDNTQQIITSFYTFLEKEPIHNQTNAQDLLYIIDDVNFVGGAHIATKLQIQSLLSMGRNIAVYSNTIPNVLVRKELNGASYLSWHNIFHNVLAGRRLMDCLLDMRLKLADKRFRWEYFVRCKIKKDLYAFGDMVISKVVEIFNQYQVVCVMSEASAYRKYVAQCTSRKKVQWIHTDYQKWINTSVWAQEITSDDGEIYRNFDQIVVLSHNIKSGFLSLYPYLVDKVTVNANLMNVDQIRYKAFQCFDNKDLLRFVTVGRVDYSKAYNRLYYALITLYRQGYHFHWTIIGDGEDFNKISNLFMDSEIKNFVELKGSMSNPFPLVAQADVFALMSNYEGLPNTIFEALILGTPVLATDVGAISTQVIPGETGWLVDNSDEGVVDGIRYVLDHPEEIQHLRERLRNYQYNNEQILSATCEILKCK